MKQNNYIRTQDIALWEQYKSRINRVMDYIEQYIHQDFTLDELADEACFSKFHFHRIFHAFVGETLFGFIQRIRIEKAAMLLQANPDKSITQIAYSCGFNSPAAFARSFKKAFKVSASEWRKEQLEKSNLGKVISNHGKDIQENSGYNYYNKTLPEINRAPEDRSHEVIIKQMSEKSVAYLRYIGSYQGDAAVFERLYTKIFKWARARNLVDAKETELINLYHDDPEITEEQKLRLTAGITVPDSVQVDGEMNKMIIPGGKYACASFELSSEGYQAAWDWMYKNWLPISGFVPDDRLSFELFSLEKNKNNKNKNKQIVDICIPVKPMGAN